MFMLLHLSRCHSFYCCLQDPVTVCEASILLIVLGTLSCLLSYGALNVGALCLSGWTLCAENQFFRRKHRLGVCSQLTGPRQAPQVSLCDKITPLTIYVNRFSNVTSPPNICQVNWLTVNNISILTFSIQLQLTICGSTSDMDLSAAGSILRQWRCQKFKRLFKY